MKYKEVEMWTYLFDKLPDEVLEVILSNLDSPHDKTTITKASSTCANILHPQKQLFLYFEVISNVAPYLQKSDLLSTRLVCKEWKNATDTYLENSERFNDEIYFRRYSPFWPRRSRSITDFLSTMQFHSDSSPKMNPFPGRRAAFGRIRREAPDFDYWLNVRRLLTDFGSELWDLRLDFEDIPFDRFVTALSDCLNSLPSLKHLQIVYFGRPSASSDPSLYLTMRNLFPQLPYLEHLELNGTFPTIFYQSILPLYSPTLKTLKLHQVIPEPVLIPQMPALECLCVSANSITDLLRVLPHPPSTHLHHLSISIYLPMKNDFKQLFHHLQFYRTSLKSLQISFDTLNTEPTASISHFPEEPFIQTFPNLNVLKLKNAPIELLDSLESFPSVSNLEFECLEKGSFFFEQPLISTQQEVETCGVFKICGYPANQLYSSNIWKLLPYLEHCKLSCYQLFSGRELKYSYSRARYEYLQRCAMY